MKRVILLCILLGSGCQSGTAVDRLAPGGMVQLFDGMRKVGWLSAYHTEVLTVDGEKPHRRYIYGDREKGAILLTPGRHELRIRFKDSTQGTGTPIVSERQFTMVAALGSEYDVRLEDGQLLLYRWPDIPAGPDKKMTKEPNQSSQRNAMAEHFFVFESPSSRG